ncbi:cation diffusion facilitator family transporter [Candidatus Parcubacteria bacterium]|nr:MAG: cation diffusion facilitator family transporter [Candidatus Parcubacteria bacterium]
MSLQNTSGFLPVATAIVGNTLVTIAKFIAAAVSGSSVLLSEAIHSTADTLNQVLLLIGLRRSLKKADDKFEYGYGNERFFWALISACGIFFLGAGFTAYHGFMSFIHPEPIEFNWIVVAVLVFASIAECYTFYIAVREIRWQFAGLSVREQLKAADSTTLAVLLEDLVAILGVAVAIVAIVLAYITNNTVWDALGSLVIAALLGGSAIVLIIRNRGYLVGRSMPQEMQDAVIEFLNADPAIERVTELKSAAVGWNSYRITCEVEFNGDSLARAAYGGTAMRDQYDEVKNDFELFKRFAAEYADRVPRLMGRKIDEIEKNIRATFPSIRHIDIEIN